MREVISNKLASVSIRDLLLVEAVAQQRSFRLAAEKMGISTSGLSYQVKKVEEVLGEPVFERGSKVSLTAYGINVLCQISAILESVTRLEALRDDSVAPFGKALRIGIISSVAPKDLLRILELCRQHSAPTKVEIVSGKHQGLVRRLLSREIDLLISAGSDIPGGTVHAELFRERFVLLARIDQMPSKLETLLSSHPGLLPLSEDDFVPPDMIRNLQALQTSSLTRAFGLSGEHRITLVSEGYGHALLPYGWVRGMSLPENMTIVALPEYMSSQERVLNCIWRQSFSLGVEISHALHAGFLAELVWQAAGFKQNPR